MADPNAQLQTMIANMPEKTGKSLQEWTALIKASGLEKHGQIMKLLKGEHGVTHGFANTISSLARQALAEGPAPSGGDLIEAQYSGKKAHLRPILDAVTAAVQGFGADVNLAPKKTSMSFRRKKQFAVLSPATNSRCDLGIQLKGDAPTARLLAAGGMTSHKVKLTEASQVDPELISWLQAAYERAG